MAQDLEEKKMERNMKTAMMATCCDPGEMCGAATALTNNFNVADQDIATGSRHER
ncbi:MAG: hypothetical protein AAGA35_00900 [Patescibacteria group bacterium]